jgi:RHS repeat-associated protein
VEPLEYFTVDHLGSTRLVTSAAGAERQCLDYLPFGEQMVQGMGARGACYANANEPRVKFTGKERDAETGLDYFGARYFSGAQGRFTSPDPLLNSGQPWEPQSWNHYAYALNNPLRFVDPNGLWEWDSKCKNGDTACEENRQKFRDSVSQLQTALGQAKEGSKEYKAIKGVLDRIGTEGDKNNIRVAFSSKLDAFGETRPTLGGNIKMTFNFGLLENTLSKGGYNGGDIGIARASLVVHEGTHASEGFGAGLKWLFSGQERANWEGRAINTESIFYQTINRYEPFGPLWNPAWLEADRDKIEQKRRESVEGLTERLYGRKPKIQY